jgi:hypothetical protein
VQVRFPVLLDLPAPQVSAYPRESVVAEKIEAMVRFGIANSRMKDYFDLWVLVIQFPFDGESMRQALTATFQHRGTNVPSEIPVGLSPEFALDSGKRAQWRAFLNRGGLLDRTPELDQVIRTIESFVEPLRLAIVAERRFARTWSAGGPWQERWPPVT